MTHYRRTLPFITGLLDLLLTRHPRRTCFGLLLGVFLQLAISSLPVEAFTRLGVDPSILRPWFWFAAGVLAVHIRTVFEHIFPPPLYDTVGEIIELIAKGSLSEPQKRAYRRKLILLLSHRLRTSLPG